MGTCPFIGLTCHYCIKVTTQNSYGCCNVKELLRVGLHWCVPFIEVLSETTSGLVAGSDYSEEHA